MSGDIDIDFRTDFNMQSIFGWVRASMVKNELLRPHPCGYYPQAMAADPQSGLAAIPYDVAEGLGYTKIDALHLSVYDCFESRAEILALLEIEPDWSLLLQPSQQKKLFQLSRHGDILELVRPRSVPELADVLALIRPGSRHLARLYRKQPEQVRSLLYAADADGYTFKKSHATAYALVIVLQLHLLQTGML